MLSVSVRLSSTVSVSLMWHVGLDPDGVKDGRIKMAGVTATFLEGATAEALPHAGGWRTPTIALPYTHNSVSFLAGRGGLNSLSARPLSSLVSL